MTAASSLLVTGAAGFIGARLSAALLASERAFDRLILADRSAPVATNDPRVVIRAGDMTDPQFVRSLVTPDVRVVFHLAGIVSGAAEADLDAGLRTNIDGTRHLLDACRALPEPARVIYASSIAVYGAPLPVHIDDGTLPAPTLSYGTQKLVCEQLINDFTRRGLIDGRTLRLPGIVVRPPQPNGALSAFNSDIIREPLAGRAMTSPVSPQATIWVMSIDQCVRNFLLALRLPRATLGGQRALLLPAVAVSIEEILDAVSRASGRDGRALVRYAPDPHLEEMFGRWPRALDAERARGLGFAADVSIDAIVAAYRRDAKR